MYNKNTTTKSSIMELVNFFFNEWRSLALRTFCFFLFFVQFIFCNLINLCSICSISSVHLAVQCCFVQKEVCFLCFYVVDLLFVFVKILVVAIDLDQVIEIIKIQQILLVYCAKLAVVVLQVSDDFVFELEMVWIFFH